MRKIYVVLLVFIIYGSAAFAQSEGASEAFNRGTSAANDGQFQLAKMYYESALESLKQAGLNSSAQAAKIEYNLGVCNFRLGESGEAVKHFKLAVRLRDGKYQKAFYALGMAQTELGNWKAARESYISAINLKKDDPEAWFDLALIFCCEKNYDKAAEVFRAAIKYGASDLAASHNNLGVILAFGGAIDSAEAEFQVAVSQADEKFPVARQNLQILRAFRQKHQPELLAKLEINKKRKHQ
ncbi:MAG: tetratricopeptide repeat protein [Acidobacteria bacterium]|nr:tetratricopeptide repeat protein [Acidobacteriota bacterium]